MFEFNPVPKPVTPKKKKQYNGYKDKPNRKCYYTGEYGAERHEVYGGPNRQSSITYGFQVDLCKQVHARFHDPQTEEDFTRINFWKEKCQRDFEKKLIDKGFNADGARKFFISIIGKNYL